MGNTYEMKNMLELLLKDMKIVRDRQEYQISEPTKMTIRLAMVKEMEKVLADEKIKDNEIKGKIASWRDYIEII